MASMRIASMRAEVVRRAVARLKSTSAAIGGVSLRYRMLGAN
jgi:hypothetical protein